MVNQYRELANERGIQLLEELDNSPFHILSEPDMFRSILTNLLDNAIKYTSSGGKVIVGARVNEPYGEIFVKDTGMGIPRKEQERIFERFYRVDKARSRAIGGTGLGLSIVKHLCELQRASITVESEEHRGSCFTVIFTLVPSSIE